MLVEFDTDTGDVLLSDFELWHYVLNYAYLPSSIADEERFDALLASLGARTPAQVPITNRLFHSEVRKSWDRIFDVEWSEKDIASAPHRKSIQAVLWSLGRESVTSYRVFVAR